MQSRSRWLLLLCGGALTALSCAPMFSQAKPEDAGTTRDRERVRLAQADGANGGEAQPKRSSPPASRPKPRTEPVRPSGKAEPGKVETEKSGGTPAGPAPSGLAGAAASGASTSNAAYDIAARLSQNGAGTCAGVIDAEAAPSMVGVTESDTVSQWSTVEPRDKHAASVFIGQRYGANPAVPYGVTGLVASPNPSGSCDVTVVQVVASPLPCGRVRETLARGGKVLGELAGIPLMQSADGQTMLMPTATNTCVLVGFHSKFGN